MSNMVVKFIFYNVCWFLTAFAAKTNYVDWLILLFSALLLWNLRSASWRQRFETAAILGIGILFDTLCAQAGVIEFYTDGLLFLPRWLLALWILFAWIAPDILFKFRDRRVLISVLSSFFGPFSYYSGISFGIVAVPSPAFFVVYSVFWGTFIYLVHFLSFYKPRGANGN